MGLKPKWWIYNNYLTIVSCALALTAVLTVALYLTGANWQALLGVVGGLLSFVFFVQRQQLEEAKLIKELISDFNKRYDGLNNRLNDIGKTSSAEEQLSVKGTNTLYDYFNLCGEEYLYYRRGYIYPEVWNAWLKGMQSYFKDERIQGLWEDERGEESYYGLENVAELIGSPAAREISNKDSG